MQGLISAVVVDAHPFFRDGVARGLAQRGRIRVVGEAGGGRDGLAMIADLKQDVAVVDYQMPEFDGLALVAAAARDGLSTRILLLSAATEGSIVYAALEAGAAGYISKDASRAEIVEAVADVAAGRTVVPPGLATMSLSWPGCKPPSKIILAAPTTVWAASLVAALRGKPAATPPSLKASMTRLT